MEAYGILWNKAKAISAELLELNMTVQLYNPVIERHYVARRGWLGENRDTRVLLPELWNQSRRRVSRIRVSEPEPGTEMVPPVTRIGTCILRPSSIDGPRRVTQQV